MVSGRKDYLRFESDIEVAEVTPPREDHPPKKAMEDSTNNPYLEKELSRVFSEDYDIVDQNILDPRGRIIYLWNRILFAACLTSLFVDPLFFLLPRVQEDVCIHSSGSIQVILTSIRTVCDMFFIIHIFVQFRTAYVAPSSRVIGRGELVINPAKIAKKYLQKQFWIDCFAAQPIPQFLIWAVLPHLRGSDSATVNARQVILICIISQYILRLCLIIPLASQINKRTGVVLETAWAGTVFNLMLYMLASHITGCLWYLLSIDRQEDCWRKVCGLENIECHYSFLDCGHVADPGRDAWLKMSNITSLCDPSNGFFDFGIYGDAITLGVTSAGFVGKFYYCLWWAMRNLNCFGQELSVSMFPGEITYAMVLGTLSLLLFGLLIANMQTYLQSSSSRMEQWRIFKNDVERWMRHRHLPYELKQSVRKHHQHKWTATQGVDEETILNSLPRDLRRVLKRHLCLDLVRKVRLFEMMDQQMLDAICERLKPCLYDRATCVIQEGDPVNEMLFIIKGRINSHTTDGGRTDFFNSCIIGPGDFCGEELLTWALDPRSTEVPSSARTVLALTEIEAFALSSEDLKFLSPQFHRLDSKKLRHAIRYHSPQWRTWAACFIQAAWFRYKKSKEGAELKKMKTLPGSALERTGSTLYRVATSYQNNTMLLRAASNYHIYASRLAASTRRGGAKPEDLDLTVEKAS